MGHLILGVIFAICSLTVGSSAEKRAGSGTKQVVIDCGAGQNASAGGQYGGASFNVYCPGGETQSITAPASASWSMRIGVEDASGAHDCFASGSGSKVRASCVGTVVTIR